MSKIIDKLAATLQRNKIAVGSIRSDLDAIREQRAALVLERSAVENARIDHEEAVVRIDAMLDAAARGVDWSDSLLVSATPVSNLGERFAELFSITVMGLPSGATVVRGADKTLGAICAFIPAARASMREALIARASAAGTRNGISAVDRAKKLADLDAEILTLERAEERYIRTAAEVGIRLARRADAAAAAFLAHDEDL
ncbi:hypothetical protein [Phyllobacterium myrsinacearum]|uniref:Uncharacterized protein n=1 Tax=Phyllobacterium myrsinacearum TaxID=28101 RepID=A0A839EG43_9HYPH|nr:hypothetical protein [Phyllobacterium myrsinacearum]MBA8877872.1 hypothetical protein [Phyllobacterium myrsinacearum]